MRSNDDGRNPDDSSKEPLLRELEGYVEMGMRRKACILARQILAQKRISPRAFLQVIKTIGMFSDPKKWLTELESAWQRQSAAFRRETNSEMLVLYGSTNEWEKAACHAKPRRLRSAADFLFGIEALLQVGRMKEAASAARRARRGPSQCVR